MKTVLLKQRLFCKRILRISRIKHLGLSAIFGEFAYRKFLGSGLSGL